MAWSRTEHTVDAGLLAQKTGAGMTTSTGFSLPAARHPRPPCVSSKLGPHPGAGHLTAQDQTPVVSPSAPPLCSVFPSLTSQAVSCVFVRGHPVPFLYSGNLWKGLVGGGQLQKSSGIPPLTPSLLGFPVPGSAQFFKVSSCLLVDSLLWSPPISTAPLSPLVLSLLGLY